jgi:hypothetical protein
MIKNEIKFKNHETSNLFMYIVLPSSLEGKEIPLKWNTVLRNAFLILNNFCPFSIRNSSHNSEYVFYLITNQAKS